MAIVLKKSIAQVFFSLAGAFLLAWSALAQAPFPNKQIRIVVPYAAGSNADVMIRLVVPKWSEYLKQPIVIENRVGASGTVGAALVAKSAPDGYTLLVGNAPTHTSGPVWVKVPYDSIADFTPIARIVTSDYTLVVGPGVPAKSLSELISYVKSAPANINYATLGDGTGVHLSGVGFAQALGVDIRNIPYNANGPALVDVSTSIVTMIFYPYPPMAGLIKSGKLRPLATTGTKRSAITPDLPTMKEAGLNYSETSWHGVFAPSGVSKEIVEVLYSTLAKALADPVVATSLTNIGVELDPLPPAQFDEFIKSQAFAYKTLGTKLHLKK